MRTHRFIYEDFRLYNAVKGFHHDRIGSCQVHIVGDRLSVYYKDVKFFEYDRKTGYWRVDSWGSRRPWLVEKMNACLSAINAEVRAFLDERQHFCCVHANGIVAYNINYFNNRFYEARS